jgi:hypothetical protein
MNAASESEIGAGSIAGKRSVYVREFHSATSNLSLTRVRISHV